MQLGIKKERLQEIAREVKKLEGEYFLEERRHRITAQSYCL